MPIKGIQRVRRNLQTISEKIAGPVTEKALVIIAREGAAESAKLTPIDSSNLINSLMPTPTISATSDGKQAVIGYTADYAAAVHDMPGKLKGQPREHFGKTAAGVAFGGGTGKGKYWDPKAEPQFLTKGFEKIKPDIPALIKAAYEL